MERVKGGSLADFILFRRQTQAPLSEAECRIILKQILQGLDYIHGYNILHRDLKPANILMKSFSSINNSIKIADFGLCTQLQYDSHSNPTERCGTRCYMAPEQIQGKSYWKVRASFRLCLPFFIGSRHLGHRDHHVRPPRRQTSILQTQRKNTKIRRPNA